MTRNKKGPRDGGGLHLTESFKLATSTVTNLYLRGYLRFPIPDDLVVAEVKDYSECEPPSTQLYILATNQGWQGRNWKKTLQRVLIHMETKDHSPWWIIGVDFLCVPLNKKAAPRIESLAHWEEDLVGWPTVLSDGFKFKRCFSTESETAFPYGLPFHPCPLRRSQTSMVIFTDEVRPGNNWRSIGKLENPVDKNNYDEVREHFRAWLKTVWSRGNELGVYGEYRYFRIGYDGLTGNALVNLRRSPTSATERG